MRTTGSDIVVCGRNERRSRYRLPLVNEGFDPKGDVESVSRERHRLMEGGESGTGSCSPSGGGGWTGCLARSFRRSEEQAAGH